MIRSCVKLSCLALLLSNSVLAAAEDTVRGTVIDSEGAAIEKAHVVIRVDASGRRESIKSQDLMILTDKRGHFSMTVSPGFYDVCVMADAFSPRCEKVFVEHEPLSPKIRLRADPEVMKRLGDKF